MHSITYTIYAREDTESGYGDPSKTVICVLEPLNLCTEMHINQAKWVGNLRLRRTHLGMYQIRESEGWICT